MSPAEQRAEQLCEEERYFSLYNNDFEEELYKGIYYNKKNYSLPIFLMHAWNIFENAVEENQKRSISTYGQIGFNYDESSSPLQSSANEKAENEVKDETPDEIYTPHPRFYVPPNMELVCNYHNDYDANFGRVHICLWYLKERIFFSRIKKN